MKYRRKSDVPFETLDRGRQNVAAVLGEAGASQAQVLVLSKQFEQRSWRRLVDAARSLGDARTVTREELLRLAQGGGYKKGGNVAPEREEMRCSVQKGVLARMRALAKQDGSRLGEYVEAVLIDFLEEQDACQGE